MLHFEQSSQVLCLLAVVTKIPGLPKGFKLISIHSVGENGVFCVVFSDLSHQTYHPKTL
jgi:hypothetical protein